MVGFMHPHKVVARKNIFLVFPSAWNGGELEGGGRKWKVKMSIFINGKKIELTRDS
jgi:hypothetical protein